MNTRPTMNAPKFRELTPEECQKLLSRHHVGRLAFTFHDRVDLEPINYVLDGEWLYARTAPGTKLLQLSHNPWVAFEVDEIAGPFDWRSVVAHGTAYFITPRADPAVRDEAVRLLQTFDSRALTDEDLVPDRTRLFRIHMDSVTGRSASTA